MPVIDFSICHEYCHITDPVIDGIICEVEKCLNELSAEDGIEVCADMFEGVYFNLKDKNVLFTVNNELKNEDDADTMQYKGVLWKRR